jgi:hypothetical protein
MRASEAARNRCRVVCHVAATLLSRQSFWGPVCALAWVSGYIRRLEEDLVSIVVKWELQAFCLRRWGDLVLLREIVLEVSRCSSGVGKLLVVLPVSASLQNCSRNC